MGQLRVTETSLAPSWTPLAGGSPTALLSLSDPLSTAAAFFRFSAHPGTSWSGTLTGASRITYQDWDN